MAEQMNIFFCSVFTNEDCSNLPEAENSYNGDDPLVDTDITEEMECIVRYAIVNRLKKNNIIRSSQHGFMAGRSCITNLLEYLEDLTHLVDQGHSVNMDFAIQQGIPQEADLEVCWVGYQWQGAGLGS